LKRGKVMFSEKQGIEEEKEELKERGVKKVILDSKPLGEAPGVGFLTGEQVGA
jgi:hypothetical protein